MLIFCGFKSTFRFLAKKKIYGQLYTNIVQVIPVRTNDAVAVSHGLVHYSLRTDTLVPVLSARAMAAKAEVALASRFNGGCDIRQN